MGAAVFKTQPKGKRALHETWQSETKEEASKNMKNCVELYAAKYPKAIMCLEKYPEALVRLRTTKSENCGSRATTLGCY
jgi:putative transposase